MKKDIELKAKVDLAYLEIKKIIKASEKVADSGSLGSFYMIEANIKNMKLLLDNGEKINSKIFMEFGNVLRISEQVFEGSNFNKLLWDINKLLK